MRKSLDSDSISVLVDRVVSEEVEEEWKKERAESNSSCLLLAASCACCSLWLSSSSFSFQVFCCPLSFAFRSFLFLALELALAFSSFSLIVSYNNYSLALCLAVTFCSSPLTVYTSACLTSKWMGFNVKQAEVKALSFQFSKIGHHLNVYKHLLEKKRLSTWPWH